MKRPVVLCVILLLVIAAHSQGRFDVIITEIMADPTPQVGLPNAEYIEIRNMTGRDINLQGWRLGTTSSLSGAFSNYTLKSDGLLILCSNGSVAALNVYGSTLGVGSFPSLPNDGGSLRLISNAGAVVHFVTYSDDWYGDALKKEGGWSLEMVDPRYPCSGKNNWHASISNEGGTPGKQNSVEGSNKDEVPPALLNAYMKDPATMILQFDEPVDSTSTVVASFTLNPVVTVQGVSVLPPTFTQVQLKLASPLNAAVLYTINFTGIQDCAGNKATQESFRTGLPQIPFAGDIVINEILFNPRPNASDFVELYNRSDKVLDASKLLLANRNTSGTLSSFKALSEQPFYIFPGDHVVVTSDKESLTRNYLVKHPNLVLVVSSMPSYPDDKGIVVLTNAQGEILDEVHYSDKWHFALLQNTEGVSLERVDPNKPSNNAGNWHSAAATAGYGTPTYRNSQFHQLSQTLASVAITPKVFSPDNDGHQDIATIQYQLAENGYMANVRIYDVAGRMVRHLVKNDLLGLQGSWTWDGLDENRQQLPVGHYILLTEIFNLQGKKEVYKQSLVLARRMK